MPLSRSPGVERSAEIVLGQRPIERHALGGIFLQRLAIGLGGFVEGLRAALALAEGARSSEIVLGRESSGMRARGYILEAPPIK